LRKVVNAVRHFRVTLVLLSFFIPAACSSHDDQHRIPVGKLEHVWTVQPEDADSEPWFGRIIDVEVWNGLIFVSDSQRNQILILSSEGDYLGAIGREGNGPGEFRGLTDITISPSGTILAAGGVTGQSLFSPDGTFLERRDFAASVMEKGLRLYWPLFLDDTATIWSANPRIRDPFASPSPDTPLLVRIEGDDFDIVAVQRVSDSARNAIERLYGQPSAYGQAFFTQGVKIAGPAPGEFVYVRKSDPYSIQVYRSDGAVEEFHYLHEARDDWYRIIEIPTEEAMRRSRTARPRAGEELPLLTPNSSREVWRAFLFSHALQGLALVGKELFLLVEVLAPDYGPDSGPEQITKRLYTVDLDQRKAVLDTPFEQDGFCKLVGAIAPDLLVFTVSEPYPGLAVYRLDRRD
jgi:hypothetical protein